MPNKQAKIEMIKVIFILVWRRLANSSLKTSRVRFDIRVILYSQSQRYLEDYG